MKNIVTYLMLVTAFLLSACSEEEMMSEPEYLPVNYANIAGTWKLSEWNGQEMGEERYCYLVIGRKADEDTGKRTLDIYMNMDSDKSRHLTSTYELEEDEDLGTIISGMYDHSAGFWNNSYLISELEYSRMVWTVSDDFEDVSVYVRCDEVPEDILSGTRAIK
ncbi:lipocalin family protein [Bacteroides oleiciplenus]|uniref:lipocalin family protein n=1 Tax=Bacteroides oleiciplenus TaxID=626931 RepID=UPI0026DC45CF|nr:lipocalin family protein [Bacteroides oleiciplenus]